VQSRNSRRRKHESKIEQSGAVTDEKSQILVKATLGAENSGTVDGMSGTMFTQSISLAIEFIDEHVSRIIATVSAKGKGMGKNENEAIDKGISSLKIPMRELGNAVANVRNP